MKIFKWAGNQSLFLLTLLFLAFVPLYPKIPLVGIAHIWVYIRVEDLLVALMVLIFAIQLVRRKATLVTSLTIPIFLYWIIGAVATGFAIIFIFPHIANVFPNVAVLFFLRHIEYMIVFFIAYGALYHGKAEDDALLSKYVSKPIATVISTIALVYIGYFVFDIIQSTASPKNPDPFIAAAKYGVFCISYILIALLWCKKRIYALAAVLTCTLVAIVGYGIGQRYLGFPAFLTGNEEFAKGTPLRISAAGRIASTFAGHYDLAAYLVMIIPILASMIIGFKNWWLKIILFLVSVAGLVLLLMTASRTSFAVYLLAISFMLLLQKKKWFIIPVVIASIVLLQGFQGISQRFSSTITQVDVVVDARTGKAIGIASQDNKNKNIVIKDIQSTGENLPQGSSYINLPNQEAQQTTTTILRKSIKAGTNNEQTTSLQGDFAIKKVLAYDVSFTTRFQGEWPRAIEALKRNYLLGSGFSSISLATDGNYLRILGETGILGFVSFFAIFAILGIYAYRVLPDVTSKPVKSFIIGVIAALFGLGLNAILIDVFEASKVAFTLWALVGVSAGFLHQYQKKKINYVQDLKTMLTSFPAVSLYLMLTAFLTYSITFNNYFVGDDFTWLRWVADCQKIITSSGSAVCEPASKTILNFFIHSDGFFYRPLAKFYYFILYTLFWLNQAAYHVSSVFIHFVSAVCVFILAAKIFKSKLFGFISALFFILISGNYEAIYWIASAGHLLAGMWILLGVVFYSLARDRKNIFLYAISFICIALAPFFQEVGVVGPLIIVAYSLLIEGSYRKLKKYLYVLLYFIPLPIYLLMRKKANSQWFGGDYSYKISNLPYNIFGNALGYFLLALIGVGSIPYYGALRDYGKNHVIVILGILLIAIAVVVFAAKVTYKKIVEKDVRIFLFCIAYFGISLLPFLGLGNMAPRYLYVASVGVVLFYVFILEKIFMVIKKVNKQSAYSLLFVFVAGFCIYHISELQRINRDWQHAGDITNNLQLGFHSYYADGKTGIINPVFYFVDTPIRYGTAWVFPVGLNDAMWFTFQNDNVTVRQAKSLDAAFSSAEGSTSARIFQFKKDYSVEEVEKTKVVLTPTPILKK